MNTFTPSVAGLFKLTVRNADLSVKQETGWFDNLILNQGLNRLGTAGPYTTAMVGTGSTAASVGQTSLETQIASTTSTTGGASIGTDLDDDFAYVRRTFRFTPGQADGNLSEVGMGYSSTLLFSRARIVDLDGDPTTISVLPDEYLDVTYELRLYWPTADATGTVTIAGEDYDFVLRVSRASVWSAIMDDFLSGGLSPNGDNLAASAFGAGALGAITVGPGGSPATGAGGALMQPVGSYSNNSYTRTYQLSVSITQITSSITNLEVGANCGIYKMSFDPAIPKTNANQLTLNFTLTWTRKTI